METKEELLNQMKEAERKAEVYKGTKDGSYYAALDFNGYYTAKRKLESLKE